jgi:ABC-type lipoprotein release transport system permease subunit
VSPALFSFRSRRYPRRMRTMFAAYTVLIAVGIVAYIVVGLAHH